MVHYLPALNSTPDSKVHEANMGPLRGRQNPGGPKWWPREPCCLGLCSNFFGINTPVYECEGVSHQGKIGETVFLNFKPSMDT